MLTDDLLLSLFDGQPHPLASLFAGWLASSRRFAAFASANQTKIRKKLRSTRDPEALRDLQLELETAYLLLRERSLSLVYEPQPGKLGRHPDFVVSYTTSLTFMVEVTRLRSGEGASSDRRPSLSEDGRGSGEGATSDHMVPAKSGDHPLPTHCAASPWDERRESGASSDRFADMLGSKLGQLAPQHPNLLIVGLDRPKPVDELRAIMLRIQRGAEANDPALLRRLGLRDRPDFFQHYYRLSGILLRPLLLQPGAQVILWDNPQARYPLPSRVRTALLRSHTPDAA